jgi:hypothetical protein
MSQIFVKDALAKDTNKKGLDSLSPNYLSRLVSKIVGNNEYQNDPFTEIDILPFLWWQQILYVHKENI